MGDQVGQILRLEIFFQSFRHERFVGAGQLFQIVSQNDLLLALLAKKGNAVSCFAGQDARERLAVLGLSHIVDVAGLDRAVGIKNRDQQAFRGFVANRRQLRPDLVADALELMAGSARFGKDLGAVFGIACEREHGTITVNHLLTIRIGSAGQELGGALAHTGRSLL